MNDMPADPVDRIMAVMERAFEPRYREAWNRRQVSDALILGNCHYGFITEDGDDADAAVGDAAGFYLSRAILDEEELLLFAILPDFRRRGLGGRLLERMLADAARRGMKRVFLEMRRGNPAGFLYEGHGFHPIGTRPGYYRTSDGERLDAITQERILV